LETDWNSTIAPGAAEGTAAARPEAGTG